MPAPIGVTQNGIFVSYPKDGDTIDAPSTWIAGAVMPGSTLAVNNKPVQLNKEGFFAHPVPLAVGNNQFTIMKNGNPALSFPLTVHRPAPPPSVPDEPPQVAMESLQPQQDLGVGPGDLVEFGMRASPGGQASVKVAGRVIPLQPAGSHTPNRGLDTAYGVTYQKTAAAGKDLYLGFYRVGAADAWQNETPEFDLTKDGTTVHEQGKGRLTVLTQPFLSSTSHDDTIVRVGPNAGRTTPAPAGVRVLVDGYVGDQYRCEASGDKHLWIDKADLTGNEGAGASPTSIVRTMNIENEGRNGARVVVPLNQRLPFELKQEITSGNRVQLRIYGGISNTDWITEPSTSSKATDEAVTGGRAYPRPVDRSHNPVMYITWQQASDRVYMATLTLNVKKQWGFWGEYQGTNLVVHIKGAPPVVPGSGSLKGLKICVDAGHGGKEIGAIGCSGIKEAWLNLQVAKKLEHILKQRGADVVMTRTTDVVVSLDDRVKIAADNNCDLLLSVHHNSLPDARNPWTEHGTSSYYYHPQALMFANLVRQGMVNELAFGDFHTRWQNLALCRPSRQPSSLAEVAFVCNPDEYAAMLTDAGQERAALGLAKGIEDFVFDRTVPPKSSARAASARRRPARKSGKPH